MLRFYLGFVLIAYSSAESSETWPFELVDKYVEEFGSAVHDLKAHAHYQEHEHEKAHYHLGEEVLKTAIEQDPINYDFIIIGGGTSGSVLASRLSEVPEWKILLLEAGDIETVATRVPKNWEVLRNTPYNWNFLTTPQNYSCLGMKNHQCVIPSGKMLGGSSAINSMVYTRGNPRDYDLWADQGNEGWCWESAISHYKKIENIHFEPFDKKFHHHGGLQHLEHPHHLQLTDHILKAAEELGYHTVDYNGKCQLGASVPQLTTEYGKRYSTANAYLERTAKRQNIVIKPLAQVLKVLISTHTKEAQGVQYVHGGKVFTAKAKREVILAAGAINTPKILMLSGVGTKEECDKHKISVVSELKVGHNMNIRPSFVGVDFVGDEIHHDHDHQEHHNHDNHVDHHSEEYHKEYSTMMEYLKDGKGPLSSPGIEALVFLKTNVSHDHYKEYPDIEIQFLSRECPKIDELAWMHISQQHYESKWKPHLGQRLLKAVVTLNHPHSKGYVKLNAENPLGQPIIEPHFLSDEDEIDYHTLLAGIKTAVKFGHTEEFKKLKLALSHHPVHGCEEHKFGTEDYWECAVKYLVVPTGDVSGTARMGPPTDPEAVVDNKLKVYGVHKLRVADASVIPVSMTGNLLAPNILIGEKAAHMLIEEWQSH